MNIIKRFLIPVTVAAVLSMCLANCGKKSEKQAVEQSTKEKKSTEHPTSEHPTSEHPSKDHPSKKDTTDDHPSGNK
ncbi:uncharacterized protein METZ01_LOCUS212238 [marine metagenome]|uniref:Uncharacterized protein n=1 Tax=marine metagenome TaxID=408172 RepID=A0A382FAQ9_9ZZZZ